MHAHRVCVRVRLYCVHLFVCAHAADVLGCVEALHAWLEVAAADGLSTADLEEVRPTFARRHALRLCAV